MAIFTERFVVSSVFVDKSTTNQGVTRALQYTEVTTKARLNNAGQVAIALAAGVAIYWLSSIRRSQYDAVGFGASYGLGTFVTLKVLTRLGFATWDPQTTRQ